ncbi:MAG: Uma2 family endonuclease [Chloroflexota bacterium]|nr:Uma2 family endonuclease [Chloroflexota bacterium]MDE2683048.1 Uma2 family endonuclease [Chloroflexota bacterium]
MTTIQDGTQMTLAEYRDLPETDGGLWELINGEVYQMLPATIEHQFLMDFLVRMINNLMMAVQPAPGLAFSNTGLALSDLYAPTPDIIYLRSENLHLIHSGYVECIPDLVVEILSSDRNRDLVMKRDLYASAGIPEYWTLDPVNDVLTVLELSGGEYVERRLGRDDTLTTATIPGFALPLEQLFGDPIRALARGNR